MVLGANCAAAAVTKLSCRITLGVSMSWGFCPPSSVGAELPASLPNRCGNHALFQLVLFHCISISAAAACLGQSWVCCAEDCFGKEDVRALRLLCTGWLWEHPGEMPHPPPKCGYAGVLCGIWGHVGVSKIHYEKNARWWVSMSERRKLVRFHHLFLFLKVLFIHYGMAKIHHNYFSMEFTLFLDIFNHLLLLIKPFLFSKESCCFFFWGMSRKAHRHISQNKEDFW